jgi:hypothetical protein
MARVFNTALPIELMSAGHLYQNKQRTSSNIRSESMSCQLGERLPNRQDVRVLGYYCRVQRVSVRKVGNEANARTKSFMARTASFPPQRPMRQRDSRTEKRVGVGPKDLQTCCAMTFKVRRPLKRESQRALSEGALIREASFEL